MLYINAYIWNLEGFPGGSDGKECACNARDLGSISGLARFPGEGNGYLIQCKIIIWHVCWKNYLVAYNKMYVCLIIIRQTQSSQISMT